MKSSFDSRAVLTRAMAAAPADRIAATTVVATRVVLVTAAAVLAVALTLA